MPSGSPTGSSRCPSRAPWSHSTSPWPPASCSTSFGHDACTSRYSRGVRPRTLHRLVPQCVRVALAARAERGTASLALPQLRPPALLVREHSHRELARAARALPVLRGTHLAHL